MSTRQRYGDAVWAGLLASTMTLANVYIQWATVGDVARAGGVSRATAKKYLDVLVEMGQVKTMKFGARTGYAVTSGMEQGS
jgi:response regulator of citrate/malate metabolism